METSKVMGHTCYWTHLPWLCCSLFCQIKLWVQSPLIVPYPSDVPTASVNPVSSLHVTQQVPSVRKLVVDSQRGAGMCSAVQIHKYWPNWLPPIGCVHVQAISTPQPYTSGSSLGSRGYTASHIKFSEEAQRFQRKASGSANGSVTVKVVLLRQVAKGAKIVPVVVDAVCWYLTEDFHITLTILTGYYCKCHHSYFHWYQWA